MVEDILFFTPQQDRTRTGNLNSLKSFGLPRLTESAHGFEIQVDEYEAQTIFAYNQDDPQKSPAGIVVFLRSGADELGIIHIAVRPEYSVSGRYAGAGLTFMLVDDVRRIGNRIKGVVQMSFL